MHLDPLSKYTHYDLGTSLSQRSLPAINAQVSTQSIGLQLGKLGVSLNAQNISFADEPAPKVLLDFAREVELQFLTQHITPFQPKGAMGHNATLQRLGVSAYATEQGRCSVPPPMINAHV